jgi:hypothetical protein
MGVGWSHAKTPRREGRQETDRSSAQDAPFHAPFDLSIRLATKGYRPQQKVDWIPRQESQMGLGSPSLCTFAASRQPRSDLQEIMRAKNLVHLGFFRIAMEFQVSRSSYHLQVTRWDVL